MAELTGTSDPLVVDVLVVVDVVVFVCPSLLLVVVDSYPPVMFVLLPDVFVCVFSSLAESATAVFDTITIVISNNSKISHFIITESF